MQHACSRYRTNEMRLYNIIHPTRKHLFNITHVPMQTKHYILANTGIATTIIYLFIYKIVQSTEYRILRTSESDSTTLFTIVKAQLFVNRHKFREGSSQ